MRVFVTGASGHIGSAVVADLLAAGHEVVGLARSDASAATVAALGATARRGDLDDLDGLKAAATESDGVIHVAFKHEAMFSGRIADAVAAELATVHAFGEALAGTGKPLVTASGTGVGGRPGRPITEADAATPSRPEEAGTPRSRSDSEIAVLGFADRGVRSSIVRIPPITHGPQDHHGFAVQLITTAKKNGYAGYPGDGANRWPAVHTLDVARIFRLALEKAPAGSRWHAVSDEGIPMRDIARSIGDRLGLPTRSIPAERVREYYGDLLAMVITADVPTTSLVTRRDLDWEPSQPGLLADFEKGHYFGQ